MELKAEAVIFDMDGVISDTQKHHSYIESLLLNESGVSITPNEITQRFSGVHTEKFFAELLQDKDKAHVLVKSKWERINARVKEIGIEPIDGIYELLTSLKEEGIQMAVASASPKYFIQEVMNALEIGEYFSSLVSSEEVKEGKPAPDVFLRAAENINANPENSIVIEDGISGMIAGKAAGMKVIGLVKEKDPIKYPADYLVTSLREIHIQQI